MPDTTVSEFATDIGIPVERLCEQLVEAGLPEKGGDDKITDPEKTTLLAFLRQKHGKNADVEPKKLLFVEKQLVS